MDDRHRLHKENSVSSFDVRDIRPTMDVYTLDNVYLGTVLAVVPGAVLPQGEHVPESARQSSEVSGEMLGPMPTRPLGNAGPDRQSARESYAVRPDAARSIGRGVLRVGRWWGLLDRRTIPVDDVQTVSLERVVLKRTKDDLRTYE